MNDCTKKEKNAFYAGAFGQNLLYNTVSVGLTYYFQSVIFLPALALNLIFAVGRFWDAFKDPIFGAIIDRTKTKYGKCRPYLLVSPILMCVVGILAFLNGSYSSANTAGQNAGIIAWAAIAYFLWGMAYTLGDVPFWSMPSLMTDNEKTRARLMTVSRIVGGIGASVVSLLIIPGSGYLAKHFTAQSGDHTRGLQLGVITMAVVISVLGGLFFQAAGVFTKERVPAPQKERLKLKEQFAAMWRCKPFRQIFISGVLRSPMQLFSLVQMTLIVYYFGDNGSTPYIHYFILIGGMGMAGQFLGMGLAPVLQTKMEKRKLYIGSSLLSAVPFLFILILYLIFPHTLHTAVPLVLLTLAFTGAGFGVGIGSVLQNYMVADAVDYEEYRTGNRPDGVFFAGLTALFKISAAVASLILGVVYAIVGFSGDGVRAVNDALYAGASFKGDAAFSAYRFAMFFLCAVPPALGFILSALPMRKYDLTNKTHAEMLAALGERRKEADASSLKEKENPPL